MTSPMLSFLLNPLQKNCIIEHNAVNIFLLAHFLITPINVSAQSIQYSYDNAGNRTTKFYIYPMTRSVGRESFSTEEEKEDLISDVKVSIMRNELRVFLKDYKDNVSYNIQLNTIDGKTINNVLAKSPEIYIETKNLNRGIYILTVTVDDKKHTWKLLIN